MNKILGILGLLVFICTVTALQNQNFLGEYNLQNLVRWTSYYAILSIGVSFVIIAGGIDLSIGSMVGLVGVLLPKLIVERHWNGAAAILAALGLAGALGLAHGLLITKLKLQPFIVTLCGLLLYRGSARFWAEDRTLGFGTGSTDLRSLATGQPLGLAWCLFWLGLGATAWLVMRIVQERRLEGRGSPARLAALGFVAAGTLAFWAVAHFGLGPFANIETPAPFLVMVFLALLAGTFLNSTVFGRHLFALGRNEQAARYSGIATDRMVILAYVVCALMAGVGGVLLTLDINSVQPANHGNFYELYAIAGAVLGGCSLRGGEGSILGVVIGAAVIRVLLNSINLLGIPDQLGFAIIGAVILLGVITDELVKRWVDGRREAVRRASGP